MRRISLAMVALSLCLAGVASAAHQSFYVIPFANYIPRSDGIETSDVAIANYQSTEIRVSLVLISYGLHNTANNILPIRDVTVPANGSVLLVDVLKDVVSEYSNLGANLGAILIATDDGRPFAVTSRSYLRRPDGTTVGYTVPATANFLQNATQSNTASISTYLAGLRNNDRYRTQVGFVVANAGGLAAFVELTLRDAAGVSLGTRQFFVDAGQFAQIEFPSTLIADRQFDVASLQVRILGGGALTAYAKVIDRTTQDATFIMADPPAAAPSPTAQSPFESLMRSIRVIQ